MILAIVVAQSQTAQGIGSFCQISDGFQRLSDCVIAHGSWGRTHHRLYIKSIHKQQKGGWKVHTTFTLPFSPDKLLRQITQRDYSEILLEFLPFHLPISQCPPYTLGHPWSSTPPILDRFAESFFSCPTYFGR